MSLLLSRKRQARRSRELAVLPDNWRRLPAADLRALAERQSGREVTSKRAAIAILEQETKHGKRPL